MVFFVEFKKNSEKPDLAELRGNFKLKFTEDSKSDLDGSMLCDKLLSLKSFLSDKNMVTPAFALNFIKDCNF